MCCASFYVLAQSIPPVSDPHCAYCNVNSRLIADEFDSVSVTQDGIVAIRGDRYQLFGFDGRLKTIVVGPQKNAVR